jgi:hypothetical protein
MCYSPYKTQKENFHYLYSIVRRLHSDCELQVDEAIRSLSVESSILDRSESVDFLALLRKVRRLVLALKKESPSTFRQMKIRIYTADYKDKGEL